MKTGKNFWGDKWILHA